MPRRSACSYFDCGQNLLVPGRLLSKSQKSHVSGYHTNRPITLVCRHTDRKITFDRQGSKDMDFVCLCGSRFTLCSSLQRHYQLCVVARDAALQAFQAEAQVNVPVPSDDRAASHSSNSSCSTQGVDTIAGQTLEEKMIERHLMFLEAFTNHTNRQHTKTIAAMTEHHMALLHALTTDQAQQKTHLQRTLADLHREAFEKQHSYLEDQRQIQEKLLSEQQVTRDVLRKLVSNNE
ncbi:hypothetical protein BGZ59_004569 [Podila verticillata]|nr:hypothetical protein BGZ59_004569 [Podila verticillata]KFH65086.1 hypothetical protein MVEG_08567 [Podila verticillata NRRL 6337]